jgi:hypothetical protein
MSVKTKEFIHKVNSHLNGNVIVLGGWSKHYNGYIEHYDKHWVDISITPDSIDLVSKLGIKLEITGGHSWGNYINDQFTVMCGVKPNRNFLDVFVADKLEDYNIIDGLKILTPQGSIDWHQQAYKELGHPWLLDKITKLKTLYGI